jgi:hypothetical protein
MISIIEHDKPDLPTCHMNCDDPLHPKLDKFELTKFINCHSCNLVLGKPGSGKSSLLWSFFKSPQVLRKVYHTVYLFRPKASGKSMKDDIFSTIPEDQQYTELTEDTLNDVLGKCNASREKENNCIIFDDMAAALKNNDLQKMFKEMIFNRRHIHVSIWFLVQTYKSVPPDLRKMFTNMFIFRVSKIELSDIFDESIEQDKEYLVPISNAVYDVPHNFFFVNLDSKRMFRNFDEIKLHE